MCYMFIKCRLSRPPNFPTALMMSCMSFSLKGQFSSQRLVNLIDLVLGCLKNSVRLTK